MNVTHCGPYTVQNMGEDETEGNVTSTGCQGSCLAKYLYLYLSNSVYAKAVRWQSNEWPLFFLSQTRNTKAFDVSASLQCLKQFYASSTFLEETFWLNWMLVCR